MRVRIPITARIHELSQVGQTGRVPADRTPSQVGLLHGVGIVASGESRTLASLPTSTSGQEGMSKQASNRTSTSCPRASVISRAALTAFDRGLRRQLRDQGDAGSLAAARLWYAKRLTLWLRKSRRHRKGKCR